MASVSETAEPQAEPAPISDDEFYNEPDNSNVNDSAEPEGEEQPEGEPQADPEPELDPIDAPKSWSKEDKDAWGDIPRAQQEIITRREAERDKHLRQVTMQASQTEQRVTGEARQALQQALSGYAEQISQYAGMFNVNQPDLRLLNSNDPADRDLYFQQEAQYRQSVAHREQANRQAEEARQQADAVRQQEQQLAQQEMHRVLSDEIPEWSDPSERANLLQKLEPIAVELGYSEQGRLNHADHVDILALRRIDGWKSKADKYDALMKQKMAPVRAAKPLAPNARMPVPGAASAKQVDDIATLYPNDPPRR